MPITVDDYDDCLRYLTDACAQFPQLVRSILLNGSMAAGTLRPGISDVLDAMVILEDAAFEDESTYAMVMGCFSDVYAKILVKGIRCHPFHYYALSEILTRYPSIHIPQWSDDRFSKVVLGEDIRPTITCDEDELRLIRFTYLAQRQSIQRLAYFTFASDEAIAGNRDYIAKLTRDFWRKAPIFLSFHLGVESSEQMVVQRLANVLPDFPTQTFLRTRELTKIIPALSVQELRDLIAVTLRIADELDDMVRSTDARAITYRPDGLSASRA
jgi:hypothetical protein